MSRDVAREIAKRAGNIHESIAEALPPLSHLECMECGHKQPIGDVRMKLANGWPKHCGYTMRLFTVKEMIEAGLHVCEVRP